MLTDAIITGAAPQSKPYKLWDGAGLFLYVAPTGLKSWRMKYRQAGRERLQTLGQFPHIDLAEARHRAAEIKEPLRRGIIPPADLRARIPFFPDDHAGQVDVLLNMEADVDQWVYFVQFGPTSPIKVGVSGCPSKRYKALQVSHPEPLMELARFRGTALQESLVHLIFANERQRGEWFEPSLRFLQFLERVRCH